MAEEQESLHWADQTAKKVVEFWEKQEKGKKLYTVASGITPSGVVHIGNFRELITVELVKRALEKLGKKVRFIFSWDDYDAFRKVPKDMSKDLEKYLRKPIVNVPDPFGCKHESYARHHEAMIEEILPIVGINVEFIYQSKQYRKCIYAKEMKTAMQRRNEIKAVLDKYREEPLKENWYPITIFCEKCDNDTTWVTAYDEEYLVSYECKCKHKDTFDLRKKGISKLLWRVDWPMRWNYEKVDFEPAGKDHSTVGGSFDTGKVIIKAVWKRDPPIYQGYEFIFIKGRGGKISSSAGEVVTLKDVLEVYEPEIVRWLFAGSRPTAEFAISFDLDAIKIYEDFDKCERIYFGEEKVENEKKLAQQKRIYELSCVDKVPKKIPYQPSFRHLTTVLQFNNLDVDKAIGFYEKQLKDDFDKERLRKRAECAKNWIQKHAPEDFTWTLQTNVSEKVKKSLTKEQKDALKAIAAVLGKKSWNDKDLHEEFYIIMERFGLKTDEFFKAAYNVLINKDNGPKLAAFILEAEERAKELFKQI